VKKYVERRKPLNQLSRDLSSIDHYEISVVMEKELLYSLLYMKFQDIKLFLF